MTLGLMLLILLVLVIVLAAVYFIEQLPQVTPYKPLIRALAVLLFLIWLYTEVRPLVG